MMEEIAPTPLDSHFAALMLRLNGDRDPELDHAARTVSAWRAAGHICVPASALGGAAVLKKLRAARVIGQPGDSKPLILDASGRLYLQRYWQYQAQLAKAICDRSAAAAECDEPLLALGLARFFGEESSVENLQRTAVARAVRQRFTVITGGPGTGKTWTIVVVLALLQEQCVRAGRTMRVALTAPTGKAAARMKESIQRTLETGGAFSECRDSLPHEATTIHRLLGAIPDSPYFRHDAQRPLTADVVIVDEASMVDLALMAKLFDALRVDARVVLLGDKDQLASVEAGNVLGDICAADGLEDHVVELRKSHRFGEDSGIRALSVAVNAGDAEAALGVLGAGDFTDVTATAHPPAAQLRELLGRRVVEGCRECLEARDPRAALQKLGAFRILCAVRRGPFGVENVNRLAEEVLAEAGLIVPDGAHYAGQPILITANDHALGLFNGDTGLILPDAEAGGDLRAWFLDASGAVRRIVPARLPAHETVYAMTVHKSQGSEFSRVLLILPNRDTPVATRELLYTGLTRARDSVELWFDASLLRAAIERRTERTSGLSEMLAAPAATGGGGKRRRR